MAYTLSVVCVCVCTAVDNKHVGELERLINNIYDDDKHTISTYWEAMNDLWTSWKEAGKQRQTFSMHTIRAAKSRRDIGSPVFDALGMDDQDDDGHLNLGKSPYDKIDQEHGMTMLLCCAVNTRYVSRVVVI